MKKKTVKHTHYETVLRQQRERRQGKEHIKRKKKDNRKKRLPIIAPQYIDIYDIKNANKFLKFLGDIRSAIGVRRQNILISFRDSKRITAAAGLLMLAEVDRLVKKYGASTINATKPPPVYNQFHQESRTLEAALNQIGFYELLQQKENNIPKPDNVSCWSVARGTSTDSATAGHMIEKINASIPEKSTRALYRGAIEALANSVEHAYTGIRSDSLNILDKRWWLFVGVFEGTLAVLVCDLGVGIPNTIRKTQEKSFLEKIFTRFKFSASNDADWIKAATLVKETRTADSYRGKGGDDLRAIVRSDKKAALSIYSNQGVYRLRNSTAKKGVQAPAERLYNQKRSILGTIVEWSVGLESSK